jgi:hypothetical protein
VPTTSYKMSILKMAGVDDDKKASERGLFLFDFDGGELSMNNYNNFYTLSRCCRL